jgi:hypothetical protein
MILCVTRLLVRHALYIVGYVNCIRNGSQDCRGVCQSSGFKAKTHWVGTELPRATRARDEVTWRVACSWCTRCPIEGTRYPQALYQSPDQEVSFTPLHVDWHQAIWGFHWDYSRMTHETTWPGFDGGIGPYLILWRGTCSGWLSIPNGDPGSTQIMTRHCGA